MALRSEVGGRGGEEGAGDEDAGGGDAGGGDAGGADLAEQVEHVKSLPPPVPSFIHRKCHSTSHS